LRESAQKHHPCIVQLAKTPTFQTSDASGVQLRTGPQLGLASLFAKNRDTLHIHTNHSINTHKQPTPTCLGKVYTRVMVVPPSSPHQPAFVCGACSGTSQVGVLLVSLFSPIFKKLSLYSCAWLEGTPAMDHGLKGNRKHISQIKEK